MDLNPIGYSRKKWSVNLNNRNYPNWENNNEKEKKNKTKQWREPKWSEGQIPQANICLIRVSKDRKKGTEKIQGETMGTFFLFKFSTIYTSRKGSTNPKQEKYEEIHITIKCLKNKNRENILRASSTFCKDTLITGNSNIIEVAAAFSIET